MSDFLRNKSKRIIIVTLAIIMILALVPAINKVMAVDQVPVVELCPISGATKGQVKAGTKVRFKITDDGGVAEVRYKWNLNTSNGSQQTQSVVLYKGDYKKELYVEVDVPSSARGIWELSLAVYDDKTKTEWRNYPLYVVSDYTSKADTGAPKLESHTPEGVYPVGTTVNMQFQDDSTGIYKYVYKWVEGENSDPDFVSNATPVFCNIGNTNNTATVSYKTTKAGTFFLQAYAFDGAGNQSVGFARKYIIKEETNAPTIVPQTSNNIATSGNDNYFMKLTGTRSESNIFNALPNVALADTTNTSFAATPEATLRSRLTVTIKNASGNVVSQSDYLKAYNAGTTGTYKVTYTTVDNAGNQAEKTITLNLVNYDALNNKINEAEAKKLVSSDYISDAWKNYTDALNNAKNLPNTSTQETVNNALKELEDAMNALLNPDNIKELDTGRLDDYKDNIDKLNPDDYTNYDDIQDKIDEAEKEILQSELDKKLDELEKTKLILKPLVLTDYNTLLNKYNNLNEIDYNAESWKALKDAMDELANIVKENPQVTTNSAFQEKVTKANELLNNLVIKVPTIEAKNSANITIQGAIDESGIKYINAGDKISFSLAFSSDTTIDTTNQTITIKNDKNETVTVPVTITKDNTDGYNYTITFEHTFGNDIPEGSISYEFVANKTVTGNTVSSNNKLEGAIGVYDRTAPVITFDDKSTEKTETPIFVGSNLEYNKIDDIDASEDVEITPIKLEISTDNGKTYTVIDISNFNNPVSTEGMYRVTYEATDKAGNTSNVITRNITVNNYIESITVAQSEYKHDYIVGEKLDITNIKFSVKSGITTTEMSLEDLLKINGITMQIQLLQNLLHLGKIEL